MWNLEENGISSSFTGTFLTVHESDKILLKNSTLQYINCTKDSFYYNRDKMTMKTGIKKKKPVFFSKHGNIHGVESSLFFLIIKYESHKYDLSYFSGYSIHTFSKKPQKCCLKKYKSLSSGGGAIAQQ